MKLTRYAAAAALVLTLTACSDDGDPQAEPTPSPSESPSASEPTPSPSATDTSPADPGGSPTTDAPASLEWQPVEGSVDDTVTQNADATLTVTGDGKGWRLEQGGRSSGSAAANVRVSDALLDQDWAVVVLQDPTESEPARAEVTGLATGDTFAIDGSSDVPTTNGGTWALGDGRLLHATYGPGRAYCLAEVDLASRDSELGWCAPKRHGFNGARIGPGGVSVLSFDAGRVSCRTLMAIDGTEATPFEGVEDCAAWDGLLTEDGQVWSEIPNERRIEEGHFYATAGGEESDLGPGTAGSLAWCGGAAWFARDPQTEGDPAALMRWTAADGLTVAYESPGGRAFLSEPRCGGDQITVTALAEDGDEQVTARLG